MPGFAELLARPDVVEGVELRSRFGFMAFHGGLEAETEAIAAAAAERAGASLYVVVQPAELRWHVPSHLVTPAASAALAAFVAHVEVTVALHGYGRRDRRRQLLLGGRNRTLAGHLAAALAPALPGFHVVTELDSIPVELRGLHDGNPVNLPPGGGVQVELPPSVRGEPALVHALAGVAAAWPLEGAA